MRLIAASLCAVALAPAAFAERQPYFDVSLSLGMPATETVRNTSSGNPDPAGPVRGKGCLPRLPFAGLRSQERTQAVCHASASKLNPLPPPPPPPGSDWQRTV